MDARRFAGAVAGGVAAGLGLTALLMWQEKKTGQPSELTRLERTSLARLGEEAPPADQLPSPREQAMVQGGHLALSAMAGAAYAAATDDESSVLGSGITFGLLFYGTMHWILGPFLKVKEPEWRAPKEQLGMHTLNHVLFGIATAAAAKAAQRKKVSA
jgi:hypothetical protein